MKSSKYTQASSPNDNDYQNVGIARLPEDSNLNLDGHCSSEHLLKPSYEVFNTRETFQDRHCSPEPNSNRFPVDIELCNCAKNIIYTTAQKTRFSSDQNIVMNCSYNTLPKFESTNFSLDRTKTGKYPRQQKQHACAQHPHQVQKFRPAKRVPSPEIINIHRAGHNSVLFDRFPPNDGMKPCVFSNEVQCDAFAFQGHPFRTNSRSNVSHLPPPKRRPAGDGMDAAMDDPELMFELTEHLGDCQCACDHVVYNPAYTNCLQPYKKMYSNYFGINDEILSKVPKMLNKSRKDLRDDVQLLKEWCKSQPHFPEVMDEKRLENFVIQNKFSIERTKQKLDMYYTIRLRTDDIYDKIHPKYDHIQEAMDIFYCVPLPKLTEDCCRVLCFKLRDVTKANSILDPINTIRCIINLAELQLKEDCWFLNTSLIDMKDISIGFMQKTFVYIPKLITIFENVYSLRVKNIYILHPPPIVNVMISLLKTLLKPKLFLRLEVLENEEAVLSKIPKQILPSDYNGDEKSLEELNNEIKKKYVENAQFFENLDVLTVSEILRPVQLQNNDTLGFHGTFKKLNVD